jgi:hypothetical protein
MSPSCTYWIDFKIPRLPWLIKVDDDLFILQTQLLQHNVDAVRKRTSMISIEGEFERVAVSSHGWIVEAR